MGPVYFLCSTIRNTFLLHTCLAGVFKLPNAVLSFLVCSCGLVAVDLWLLAACLCLCLG